MKKILLLTVMLIGTLAIHAEEYAYLTFETNSGEKFSVPASSLTISISGNTLTTNGVEFTLTNLNKMYFSNTNETTNIESVTIEDWDKITDVFDINGRKVSPNQMQKGLYIVKSKSETYKVVIK